MLRTQLYWDFEPANDDADPRHADLARFNFGPDSDNGKQIAFIRALAARGVKLIASAWTPADLDEARPGRQPCVVLPPRSSSAGGRLDPAKRDEFAEYLVTYVKLLKEKSGVDLYALSFQNEPLFAQGFESCVYKEADYAKTLEVVGARFRAVGLRSKLFGPEHMGSFMWIAGFFEHLLDDKDAARYLDIYAVHSCGTSTAYAPRPTAAPRAGRAWRSGSARRASRCG